MCVDLASFALLKAPAFECTDNTVMDKSTHGLHLIVISLDDNEDVHSAHHVASDSDSEVYCDSVDQFGAEEVRPSSLHRNWPQSSLSFVSVNHPSVLSARTPLCKECSLSCYC